MGRIDRERRPRCGYRISQGEEEQERMGRLLRNSRIGLVSLLAGVWRHPFFRCRMSMKGPD